MIDLRRWRCQCTLESRGDVVDDELRELAVAPRRRLKHQRSGMPNENEDRILSTGGSTAVVDPGSTVVTVVPLLLGR